MSQPSEKAIRGATIAGWLFVAAGAVATAAIFVASKPLLGVGAPFFFVASILFFLRARSLRKRGSDP